VPFAPLSGLFSRSRFLSLRWLPKLLLELDVLAKDWLWTAGAYSNTFVLSEVNACCDIIEVDPSLDNAIGEDCLSGRQLMVPDSTFATQVSSPNGVNDFTLQSLRGFSRAKSIPVTFWQGLSATDPPLTPQTALYGPMGSGSYAPAQDTINCSFSLGPDVEPLQHTTSYAQAYYVARLGSGHFTGDNSWSITPADFR
jgi:hypothetical protein